MRFATTPILRMLTTATLVVICSAAHIAAQTPPKTPQAKPPQKVFPGRVVGVFDEDTGDPIEGAEIKNMLNNMSAVTTVTGTLSLFFVDTVSGILSIRKLGYEPQTLAVTNAPNDSTGITIVLKRTAQVLPTVVTKANNSDSVAHYISPALQGFEERRHQGSGYFVSEADLRKHQGEHLDEVIGQHLAGAHMLNGLLVSTRSSNRRLCYATVYMNGILYFSMTQPGQSPPNFSQLAADEYAGIEFYAGGGSLPVQYSKTDAGCGTLLLWTRER